MARTITRPQADALRTAELAEDSGAPSGDALAGRRLVSARANTAAVLVRLGLVEEITVTAAGESYSFHALTRAGELIAVTLEPGGDLPRLDYAAEAVKYAAAEEDAQAAEEHTPRPDDGTYYPNAEGARTWREACPLWLDGKHVTAAVECDGTRLYVFLGTETIYSGDLPKGIKTSGDVAPWVRQYATGYVWAAEYRTLWSYRDHAGHIWGPYADAECRATSGSAEAYCRGIVDTVGAGQVIRIDRTPTHFETTGRNWRDVHTVTHTAGAPADAPAEPSWEVVKGEEITPGDVIRLGRGEPWVTVEDVNPAPHGAGLLWVDTAPVPGLPTLREISRHMPVSRAVPSTR